MNKECPQLPVDCADRLSDTRCVSAASSENTEIPSNLDELGEHRNFLQVALYDAFLERVSVAF